MGHALEFHMLNFMTFEFIYEVDDQPGAAGAHRRVRAGPDPHHRDQAHARRRGGGAGVRGAAQPVAGPAEPGADDVVGVRADDMKSESYPWMKHENTG